MIRFAVAGCGRIAPRHFESIAALEQAELVAVCDVDPKALERATSSLGVAGYRSLESMLVETRPDVCVLATPSGLHPEQTLLAASKGCHVLTEKPMAIRWRDAERMVQACDDAGVRLFVVKQHRFNPAVQQVRRAVEAERFGRIYDVHLSLFWQRDQAYYDLARWRGTWELDGGALMNQAIHYIDLVRWLVGPVESVHAFTSTLARRIEVEDTAAVSLRFRSGALGTMNVTMLTHQGNYEGALTILGESGTVRLGGVACNRIDHWEFDDDVPPEEILSDSSLYGVGHPMLYQDVCNSLMQPDQKALIEGREGMKALEIVVAAYQSAQEGRRVGLPLS